MRAFVLVLPLLVTSASADQVYQPPSQAQLDAYEHEQEVFNACLRGKATAGCPLPERPQGTWKPAKAPERPPEEDRPPTKPCWTLWGLSVCPAVDPHRCSLAETDRVPNQLFCARDNREREPDPGRSERVGITRVEPQPQPQPQPEPEPEPSYDRKPRSW